MFCPEDGQERLYLNSNYAEAQRQHFKKRSTTDCGRDWQWVTKVEGEVLVLRFDLAKDIRKKCHLNEASVNSIDGKLEQHLCSNPD